ncbi:class I SAM-dependent methyltransferase [Novipirellula artificiosorum]|uniref:class I SAM-dependent methyltransferase n=1 Tax=Novipirellula artificiosorum TaxID=2528016 RepID=UPI0011B56A55|nr:class I SAM-dependent methyltransferase [Novipirellula artificiosorum]
MTPDRLALSARGQQVYHRQQQIERPSHDEPLDSLLDQVDSVFRSPESRVSVIEDAVDQLFRGLRGLRENASVEQWKAMIEAGRSHPVCTLIHQDPFTSRAFHKPRGYAGDAVMMDYIYGRQEGWKQPKASALGSAIYQYTTGAPASAGVRERRCYIAEWLDQAGRLRSDQHVLAVAAGHLREASLSSAVRRNRFERFVAMDADAQSLEEIRQCYGRFGVEPVVANIRRMLTGRLDLGMFDLIYTTGLYDYLADSTAKRLTANLFKHLRPGGQLVIANFLPGIRDVGYMEMFMDWHLIYRSRGEMMVLADDLDQSLVEEVRIFAESNENVVIMEMTKR